MLPIRTGWNNREAESRAELQGTLAGLQRGLAVAFFAFTGFVVGLALSPLLMLCFNASIKLNTLLGAGLRVVAIGRPFRFWSSSSCKACS